LPTGKDKEELTQRSKQQANTLGQSQDPNADEQMSLAIEINKSCNLVKMQVGRYRKFVMIARASQNNDVDDDSISSRYRKALKDLQFGETSMVDNKGEYLHHFKSRQFYYNGYQIANQVI
jgi:hypothetical protein